MKCTLHNLGCKVNSYETEAMRQLLEAAGYEIVEFGSETADVYIINTCTVTNIADRKSRQMLHKAKKDNPNAVVVAAGCYVQEAGEKLLADEAVDIIVGNNRKGQIVEVLEEYFKGRNIDNSFIDINKTREYENLEINASPAHTRAYIKIQDGCNQFCTYCIIPFARGRVRSRKIESVVSEIEKIANEDIKEVVITGIHVASYGKDFDNENTSKKIRLIDLLEAINKIDGIDRIRLSSLEPTIVDEEFATRLSKLDKICDHFHLSLQSGCDETLKRMNRKYTTQIYRDAVATLRKYYPEASFTTDVIVGFPGETDEEFAKTYEFLKEIDFYRLHVFKYSPRRGTVAEKMPNQIDGNKKEERSNKLIELSNSMENKHNQSYIGKTVKVLFEEFEDGFFKGHTTNYMMVKVAGEEEQSDKFVNKILDVKIRENNDATRELIGILS